MKESKFPKDFTKIFSTHPIPIKQPKPLARLKPRPFLFFGPVPPSLARTCEMARCCNFMRGLLLYLKLGKLAEAHCFLRCQPSCRPAKFSGPRPRLEHPPKFHTSKRLALNPNFADAWRLSGWVRSWLGEPAVSLQHTAHAMRLSPLQSRRLLSARSLGCAPTTSKILGTPRHHEHGAALARPGKAAAGSRSSRSGLWLVHRRLRHARSQGGKGGARRFGAANGVGGQCRLVASPSRMLLWEVKRTFTSALGARPRSQISMN
jgi:hypothetical protein